VDEQADDRLRARLWRDQHTSVFEACTATFELVVPLFVLRQLERHRTVDVGNSTFEDHDDFRKYSSRNEFSGRYSTFPDQFWIPKPSRFKKKGTTNKQGSDEPFSEEEQLYMQELVETHSKHSRELYNTLVASGVASELARIVLPPNQYTKIRLTANLLNWMKFLRLRLPADVQEETRKCAEAIAQDIQSIWPKSYEVFRLYTLEGVNLSAFDRQTLKGALDRFAKMTLLSLDEAALRKKI
jgi:thymidylate synthase (FAD)